MISNPLDIEPGTIFICGPNLPTTGVANPDFERFEEILTQKGYKVFNPEKHVACKDVSTRVAFAARCNLMVTLPGWDADAHAKQEVNIARVLNKEIVLAEGFERWERAKQKAQEQNQEAQ